MAPSSTSNSSAIRAPALRHRSVIEILGRPGDLGVDTEIIIRNIIFLTPFPTKFCMNPSASPCRF